MIFVRSVFWALVLLLKSFIKASIKVKLDHQPQWQIYFYIHPIRQPYSGFQNIHAHTGYICRGSIGQLRWAYRAETFHAEIVVDNEKVSAETKAYKKIPQILSFTDEHGNDNMKQVIEDNYRQIKTDVLQIVECEMERIKNDPDLQHLIQQD